MAQPTTPRSSSDGNNVPGISYLERLSARYTTVLAGQTAQANNFWKGMKDGKWDHTDLGKMLVSAVEGYYDLAVAALKGPSYVVRPEWVYFCFEQSVASNPTPEAEISIELQPEGTELEQTDFVQVGGTSVLAGRGPQGTRILYKTCALTADRKAVLILLDEAILKTAPPGQYTSMICAKGRNGQPPLVIVTLVVE
jgi:hypothetical protein